MLTYEQARRTVIEQVEKARGPRATVNISVWDALGFVLADEIKADREYPPFHRSTRDGYAVRAMEVSLGATLRCVAEIKAGDTVTQPLAPGACVQIMTGAAVPDGADAVVMIEHTNRDGDSVRLERAAEPGQNIVPRGSEAKRVSDSQQQQRFPCRGSAARGRRARSAGQCRRSRRRSPRENLARLARRRARSFRRRVNGEVRPG